MKLRIELVDRELSMKNKKIMIDGTGALLSVLCVKRG